MRVPLTAVRTAAGPLGPGSPALLKRHHVAAITSTPTAKLSTVIAVIRGPTPPLSWSAWWCTCVEYTSCPSSFISVITVTVVSISQDAPHWRRLHQTSHRNNDEGPVYLATTP